MCACGCYGRGSKLETGNSQLVKLLVYVCVVVGFLCTSLQSESVSLQTFVLLGIDLLFCFMNMSLIDFFHLPLQLRTKKKNCLAGHFSAALQAFVQ